MGGNYFCAAGATKSCVHVAALPLTLAEELPIACTSMKSTWSRPSTASKAVLSKASSEGYVPCNGPKPLIDAILKDLQAAGSKPGIIDYFEGENSRWALKKDATNETTHLKDPMYILMAITEGLH